MHDRGVTVVGGGLAGSEAAWQLAIRGHRVTLHEMRPVRQTAAHRTDMFAELVCSNTFKSTELSTAHGAIKAEMRELGCMVLECADEARVAAGTALAVDRDVFAAAVTRRISAHPMIRIVRGEVVDIPESPAIIATGPLTGDALAQSIRDRLGADSLAFYDAIAPVVSRESVDDSIVFTASRYGKETMEGAEEEGAYLNCPMTADEYDGFVAALDSADQFHGHEFDEVPYFSGCMPVEEMNARGRESLRFGPLKPVGLVDPRTGRRPHAVVQLRREDKAGRLWNLVGFQTRLRIPEQQRVFRMIPGLANAEFLRYGSIHRNSYVNSPAVLTPVLSLRDDARLFLAGQITGVEGYTESTASGLLAGINVARVLDGGDPVVPPPATMLGALYRYLREADPKHFQPMNANFGLVDDLDEPVRDKRLRKERMAERAVREMREWRDAMGILEPRVATVV
ncbi:MAG: methylenetetrahydrofolate--tRNA-(uracil(54)-C(5))-methyltransferase (FADH(2)-oxidizing) TrmFO [Gemmatimonadota bacterium]|nr:methylenetetrahydrofolate--tRNA-(uracil(54)-C(5))-methyltransferase (FADH(2)-oxidizing) TrmFO [Gemmatimonadota bacterium]